MSMYSNQQDRNSYTSRQTQNVLKQAGFIAYDLTKAVIAFITSMVRMFLGK